MARLSPPLIFGSDCRKMSVSSVRYLHCLASSSVQWVTVSPALVAQLAHQVISPSCRLYHQTPLTAVHILSLILLFSSFRWEMRVMLYQLLSSLYNLQNSACPNWL